MMIEACPTRHKPVPTCSASEAAVARSALAKVDPGNGQGLSALHAADAFPLHTTI